jgi:hypothetical protein
VRAPAPAPLRTLRARRSAIGPKNSLLPA